MSSRPRHGVRRRARTPRTSEISGRFVERPLANRLHIVDTMMYPSRNTSARRSSLWPALPPVVLVVDDETACASSWRRWLASGGYTCGRPPTPTRRCSACATSPPAVALCDIRMPGHDGLWLAHRIRMMRPRRPSSWRRGVQDVGSAVSEPAPGGHRLPDEAVRPRPPARVGRAAGSSGTRRPATRAGGAKRFEGEVREPAPAPRDALAALPIDCDTRSTACCRCCTLSIATRTRTRYRVAALSASVGARLAARRVTTRRRSRRAALLHDVGKLAMPERVLRKPAPLTDRGTGPLIRQHPQIAADLIAACRTSRRSRARPRRARADRRARLSERHARGGRRPRRPHHLASPTPSTR